MQLYLSKSGVVVKLNLVKVSIRFKHAIFALESSDILVLTRTSDSNLGKGSSPLTFEKHPGSVY